VFAVVAVWLKFIGTCHKAVKLNFMSGTKQFKGIVYTGQWVEGHK